MHIAPAYRPAGGKQVAHEFVELGLRGGCHSTRTCLRHYKHMSGPVASRKRQPPPPWPSRAVTSAAVDLFTIGEALTEHATLPEVFAPQPTPAYRELLQQLGASFWLRLQCQREHCGGRLGWWRFDTSAGIAVVDDRPTRPVDRVSAARPFTAAARDHKGYRTGPNTHDAGGTYTAECSKCHRRVPLGTTYRSRLFLQALHDHRNVILV